MMQQTGRGQAQNDSCLRIAQTGTKYALSAVTNIMLRGEIMGELYNPYPKLPKKYPAGRGAGSGGKALY